MDSTINIARTDDSCFSKVKDEAMEYFKPLGFVVSINNHKTLILSNDEKDSYIAIRDDIAYIDIYKSKQARHIKIDMFNMEKPEFLDSYEELDLEPSVPKENVQDLEKITQLYQSGFLSHDEYIKQKNEIKAK